MNYYDIRYMLSAPEIRLMVAELDGVLIASGYARIEKGRHYLKHTHHAYLGFMYVVPEHRGKGVNRLIIEALKNWAIEQNINELRLDVYYDNQPAIAAYEKAGFIKHLIEMRMGLTIPAATRPSLKGMSPLLLVSDLDRSIGFYTGVLGFSVQFRYEDFYAGIGRDGYSIHLKQTAQPPAADREYKRENEHVDITFSVAAVGDLYAGLAASSVDVVQPLREMPYGREFYISDPDGYIIAFLEEF
ncbi:GNAT family N-acetyltransferase [Puia sp. P3]|uniref:GNAT family N-acetyltransferase n=1 Tax=Puia sp. P3 TaxID=3423952 RepID=UPI003D66A7F4